MSSGVLGDFPPHVPFDPSSEELSSAEELLPKPPLKPIDAPKPLAGRKVTKNPIIPTGLKLGLAFGGFICIALIISGGVLAANHVPHFALDEWAFKLFMGVGGTVGISLGLFSIYLAVHYSDETQRRALLQRALDFEDEVNKNKPPAQEKPKPAQKSASKKASKKPALDNGDQMDQNELWDLRLRRGRINDGVPYYNLESDDPNQPVAQPVRSVPSTLQLPQFGTYNKDAPTFQPPLMAIRIPETRTHHFPERLMTWMNNNKNVKNKKKEYRLLILDNTKKAKTCTFATHHASELRKYNMKNPRAPGEDARVKRTKTGISTKKTMGLFRKDQSISENRDPDKAIPDCTVEGNAKEFTLEMHGEREQLPSLSPDVATIDINIDEPLAHGFIGTVDSGGDTAEVYEFIVINDANDPEAKLLIQAMQQKTVCGFLNVLAQKKPDGSELKNPDGSVAPKGKPCRYQKDIERTLLDPLEDPKP